MDDKVIEIVERVAALEARQMAYEERMETALMVIRNDGKETKATAQEAVDTMNELVRKITKYEGKFGGVLLAVGAIWAFITGIPEALLNWIKTFGGIK